MPGITPIDQLAPLRAPNATAQVVVTIVSWVLVAIGSGFALRLARRERTWLPIAVILAVAIAVINEPLFDKVYHLYFYDHGKQWTWLDTYGYPQPNWTMSAYIIIYAFPALLFWQRYKRGAVTRRWMWQYFAGCSLFVGAFETIAINLGTYQYFGFEPYRLIKYPMWLGLMEGAHDALFAAFVAVLAPVIAKGWRPVITLPVFLVSFCSVMFGAGLPGLSVLNAHPAGEGLIYLCTSASVLLAAGMVWCASLLFPTGTGKPSAVAEFLRSLADRLSQPSTQPPPAQAPAVPEDERVPTRA